MESSLGDVCLKPGRMSRNPPHEPEDPLQRTHERQRGGGRARAKSLRLEGLGGHREEASVSGTWRRKGADGVG